MVTSLVMKYSKRSPLCWCLLCLLLLFFFLLAQLLHSTYNHHHIGTSYSEHIEGKRTFPFMFPIADFRQATSIPQSPLLRVLVLTFNRAHSLVRCLNSLNSAEFDGLPVVVDIYVDRAINGSLHSETVQIAKSFTFKHGQSQLHVHPHHVGVLGQWLSTWQIPPDSAAEVAVFLEDDLTVSRYFARWLRQVHAKYDSYPNISGYSLQGESIKHAVGANSTPLAGPPGHSVFLYPVLGSWGFSPNAGPWKHFIEWYKEASQNPAFLPYVPGLVVSQWYKQLHQSGRADTMWTMWHIYHSWKNYLYTLYPNLPDHQGLTFNWKEPGMHYSSTVKKNMIKANILSSWQEGDMHLPESPLILNARGEIVDGKVYPFSPPG